MCIYIYGTHTNRHAYKAVTPGGRAGWPASVAAPSPVQHTPKLRMRLFYAISCGVLSCYSISYSVTLYSEGRRAASPCTLWLHIQRVSQLSDHSIQS